MVIDVRLCMPCEKFSVQDRFLSYSSRTLTLVVTQALNELRASTLLCGLVLDLLDTAVAIAVKGLLPWFFGTRDVVCLGLKNILLLDSTSGPRLVDNLLPDYCEVLHLSA